MPIRDRFALALTGLTVSALTTSAAMAMVEATRRPVDVVVLWLAGLLQLGLLLAWIFIPRLPRWIVAGWGLILMATGLGVIISAPISEGAVGTFPWALVALLGFGLLTIIAAIVHSAGERRP